jgi:hypothetical protein
MEDPVQWSLSVSHVTAWPHRLSVTYSGIWLVEGPHTLSRVVFSAFAHIEGCLLLQTVPEQRGRGIFTTVLLAVENIDS